MQYQNMPTCSQGSPRSWGLTTLVTAKHTSFDRWSLNIGPTVDDTTTAENLYLLFLQVTGFIHNLQKGLTHQNCVQISSLPWKAMQQDQHCTLAIHFALY